MSALERAENGLKMSEISGALKVLNGNITGIVDRLAVEGNLIRIPVEGDRRAMRFCPGSSGRAARLSCFIPGALCRRLRVSAGGFTKVRSGQAIAAFALTEPQSGSDVANGTLNAAQDGNEYILNGEKPGFPMVVLPIFISRLRARMMHRARRDCRRLLCLLIRLDCGLRNA